MRGGSPYRRTAIRLTLLYLAVASAWIVVSDTLVSRLRLPDITMVNVAKGLAYVAVTGGLLYVALLQWVRRVEASNEALADSENNYRQLFECNPNPMWVYDLDTLRFLAVNSAAIARYGYSRDEFLDMTIADIRPTSDIPALLDNIAEVDDGLDEAGIWLHVTKDGQRLSVEITSHVVEFEGRRAEIVLANDVTGWVLARDALRSSNERLETLVDTSPLAIALLDEQGLVRMWNAAAERTFGWSPGEVLGGRLPTIPEQDWPDFETRWQRLREGQVEMGIERTRLRRDGTKIRCALYTAPVRGSDGAFEGVIAMMSDVTERTRIEAELAEYRTRLEDIVRERTEELRLANVRLQELANVKSGFLANMSHELRTPLNSIIGFSGIMLQGLAGELTEEQSKQTAMIYRSGTHLLDLINDILDISKIESGRVEVEAQSFEMAGLIGSVIESVRPQAEEKSLTLTWNAPSESIPAHTDRTKIRQILLNLIGNALKFTDEGGVVVTLESNGDVARVSVADTGPGIPAEEFALVFDEFRQAKRRTDEKPPGTGLGLAISLRLAKLLHGDIQIESELNVGSVFTLEVPLQWPGSPSGDHDRDSTSSVAGQPE